MNQTPLDPIDNQKYVYATNEQKSKYQLMAFMEGENNLVSMVPQAFAGDMSERFPLTIGDTLGIILEENNSIPISDVNTSSGSTNYKVVFKNSERVEGSGNLLSVIQAQRGDKNLASLDDSLVGYWDMESTIQSGSVTMLKDLSKYGNHGTCYNGTSSGSCGVVGPQFVNGDGRSGKTINFDGVDDYIRVRNGPYNNFGTIDFTIMSRVKTTFPGSQSCIVSIAGSGQGWRFGYGERKPYYLIGGTSYTMGKVGDTIISDGKWNHMVIIYSRSDKKIKAYVNGINSGTVDISEILGSVNISSGLWLGTMSGTSGWVNGQFKDVRIYNRALSDSEIQALYQATK